MATVRRNYDASVKRGRLTPEAVAERLARITPQLDDAGFDEADVVIEAVFESMELKRQVFAELDRVAQAGLRARDQHLDARHRRDRRRRRRARSASSGCTSSAPRT